MGILRTDKISGLETPTAVTGSVVFDGTGDYVTSSAFHISDSWTMEFWFNTSVNNAAQRPMNFSSDLSASDYAYIELGSSGNIKARVAGAAAFGDIDAPPVNQWHHTALSYDGSTAYFLLNGKLIASQSVSYSNHSIQVRFGADESNASANLYTGYISNARIVSGEALYTTDYTVPIHAFEVTDGTNLLCFNNADSAAASEHGRIGAAPPTLTVTGDAAGSTVSPGLTRDFTSGTEFRGVTTFDTQGYFVPPSGTTTERLPDFGAVDAASARGLFGGGRTPSYNDTIDYITISTTGNAQDFGNLTQARGYSASSSSRTRGVFNGGGVPGAVNTQDYITISSTGDALDFGELQTARYGQGNSSSSIRGVFGGGNPGPSSVIEFITIATTGSTQDFGDLTEARVYIGGCSSSTRGVFGGGSPSPGSNTIDYITISSTGNAINFGDLTQEGGGVTGCSSPTRGLFAGRISGNDPYTYHNIIDYITIAALGNATDFGDLTVGAYYAAGCSSSILGVFGGLSTSSGSFTNTIDYVTIASTGDAADFGDLSAVRGVAAAVSNGHGGLG